MWKSTFRPVLSAMVLAVAVVISVSVLLLVGEVTSIIPLVGALAVLVVSSIQDAWRKANPIVATPVLVSVGTSFILGLDAVNQHKTVDIRSVAMVQGEERELLAKESEFLRLQEGFAYTEFPEGVSEHELCEGKRARFLLDQHTERTW